MLDAVFGGDCNICGINLKIMWCEYTCSPVRKTFVNATGYTVQFGLNLTETTFTVNPNYACTIFSSCEHTSFIAEASLTNAEQFLDFMGNEGKIQGRSIITFGFSTNLSISINPNVYDCGY